MFDIKDNFLSPEDFEDLNEFMTGKYFPWGFEPNQDSKPSSSLNNWIMFHLFYHQPTDDSEDFTSRFSPCLEKIYDNLKAERYFRIKANLTTPCGENHKSEFHTDFDPVIRDSKTSIFYLNTNNGWTEFEDGTKVESVANRMVTFDGSVKHSAVRQTDKMTRIVINFNWK